MNNIELIRIANICADYSQLDKYQNWFNLPLRLKSKIKYNYCNAVYSNKHDVVETLEDIFGSIIHNPVNLFNAHIHNFKLSTFDKLSSIGYTFFNADTNKLSNDNNTTELYIDNGFMFNQPLFNSSEYIECDNDDMFIDIASIQAGTDKEQWFICPNKNEWYKSPEHFCVKHLISNAIWRKATPEEIINKYNNENRNTAPSI